LHGEVSFITDADVEPVHFERVARLPIVAAAAPLDVPLRDFVSDGSNGTARRRRGSSAGAGVIRQTTAPSTPRQLISHD
jgi:hypothetical protein